MLGGSGKNRAKKVTLKSTLKQEPSFIIGQTQKNTNKSFVPNVMYVDQSEEMLYQDDESVKEMAQITMSTLKPPTRAHIREMERHESFDTEFNFHTDEQGETSNPDHFIEEMKIHHFSFEAKINQMMKDF